MRVVRTTAALQVSDEKIVIKKIAICGGADAATVTIYNESDDSETAASTAAKLGVAAGVSDSQGFNDGLYLENGCYVALTGTTPEIFIYID